MRLGFVTSNDGKFLELNTAISPRGHEVIRIDLEYPELQTDSIEEVARFGLDWIRKKINTENEKPVFNIIRDLDFIILEDSGIFINALNNFPGVYSKFVFKTIGYNGIIELLKTKENRDADFKSCIAVANFSDNSNYFFTGVCNGTIVQEPRGNKGFGYDPIFLAEGASKTFAEMDPQEKNKFSHRGKAMEQLVEFFRTL